MRERARTADGVISGCLACLHRIGDSLQPNYEEKVGRDDPRPSI
jgi:hypothetical protein